MAAGGAALLQKLQDGHGDEHGTVVELQGQALPGGHVPAGLLKMSQLVKLNLSNCGLVEVSAGVSSLQHLEVLLLANNKLQTLPPEIGSLTSLTQLDAGSNQLTSVPDALCAVTTLRTLNLVGNKLTELPQEFGRLSGLRLLGLKSNQLVHLPDSFSRLTCLVELFITDNRLVDLPPGTSCLTSLVKLQASFNSFTAIPEGLLHLPALELARFAVCDIRAVPDKMLSAGAFPRLAWFGVAGNPCCPHPPPPAPGLPVISADELELGQKLGDGASGEVFRAVWRGELVAVKFFRADVSPDGRTEDEVALAVGLSHPHLTQVLAKIEQPRALVLRLENGTPMALKPTSQHLLRCKWADSVQFSFGDALRIGKAVADSLRYCHSLGICHGDVYGHNVLVDEGGHVTLCDFGASFSYDRSAEPFWEAMEVRAYGLLVRDIALRTSTAAGESSSEVLASAAAKAAHPGPGAAQHGSSAAGAAAKTNGGGSSIAHVVQALRELADRCVDLAPAARPTFQAVYDELARLERIA